MDSEQLAKLLTFGIQRGVSDIHFTVGHRPHYRVKGDLLAAKFSPMTPTDTVEIVRLLLDDPGWEPAHLDRERDGSEWKVITAYAAAWGVSEERLRRWDVAYDRRYATVMSRLWRSLSKLVRIH